MATKKPQKKTAKKSAKAKSSPKKRKCYHCTTMVSPGDGHDCWTTTPDKLTAELDADLIDAWERIREFGTSLGEQRVYASHKSIMFARKTCYFFVRPKKKYLEVCFFLPKAVKSPLVHSAVPSSKTKVAHLVRVQHRDQVEAPLTDWLAEAFAYAAPLAK